MASKSVRQRKKALKRELYKRTREIEKVGGYLCIGATRGLQKRLLRVMMPGTNSRQRNYIINETANLVKHFDSGEIDFFTVTTKEYPFMFEQKTSDPYHKTLCAISDPAQWEKADKEGELIGKRFDKAYKWYCEQYEEVPVHRFVHYVDELIDRGEVVYTVIGTLWHRPVFKQRMKSMGIPYTKMILRG